jgi:hypothetical protein
MSGWPSEDNRIGEVSEKVETATNHFVKTLARQMRTLPTGSALHVMLFLENTLQALFIFNGLRSRHCQRALLGYHYRLMSDSCMSTCYALCPIGISDCMII